MSWGLLALSAVFYALCFVHLDADFPNGSPWADWSKMTDEGWYAGGAVHLRAYGLWVLAGSFNPVVAMPVWSAMVWAWFHLVGAGMVQARVLTVLVYGLSLLLLHALVRRAAGRLAAAAAVLLMTVSPFAYAFDRLALLEPVLVLWMMLGLWLGSVQGRRDWLRLLLVGVVVCLLVLTKTTGVFLVPAVLYQVCAVRGRWLRPAVLIAGTACVLWLLYYGLVVRPHFAADYRLLFSINHDRVHLSNSPRAAWATLKHGIWMGRLLFPLAVAGLLAAIGWVRSLWRVPLFTACVIAASGYLGFIWYHANLQPRYYLVIAMPVVVVAVLAVQAAADRSWRVAAALGTGVLALSCGSMMVGTVRYVATPLYSFEGAVQDITTKMRAAPTQPILLSNSGDDISLWSGTPAVTVEYSSAGLPGVMARYRPGWFAMWPGSDDRWVSQVEQRYILDERARYKVFDDPARQTLVLYRLLPRRPSQ